MFNGDALSVSVRPLLGSITLGFLLGACGGSGSDSTELEPSLGQGNAVAIRAEYEAALKGLTPPAMPAAAADAPGMAVAPVRAATPVAAAQATASAHAAGPSGAVVVHAPLPAGVRLAEGAGLRAVASARATDARNLLAPRTVSAQGAVQPPGADPVGVTTKAEAIAHAQHYHDLARQVVEKVNELRARPQRCGDTVHPAVGPLKWNARVAYAALLESEWMVARNQFSHAWEDGKYVWHRFDMAQYAWKKADENIAAGFRSLDDAMQAWLESPSHCKAMMRADIREIGLSVLPGQADNRYRSYWTMALGSR